MQYINQAFIDNIDEMLGAVTANINYLKTQGSSQVKLLNGRLQGVIDEGVFVYKFDLGFLQEIEQDADIEVRVERQSTQGKVVSIDGQVIEVHLNAHVGDTIPKAVLIISSYYLLERLAEQLNEIKDNKSRDYSLSEKLLGIIPSFTSKDEDYVSTDDNENSSQESAIKTVLGSDVTFIWGPPGTGKSETISHLIDSLVQRNKSVLLIAHTNAATDSVLEKLVDYFEEGNNPDYLEGRVIRVGSLKTITKKLQTKNVIPEVILEKKAKPIREEILVIENKIAAIRNAMAAYQAELSLKKDSHDKRQNITKLHDYILSCDSKIEKLKNEMEALRQNQSWIQDQIDAFQAKGSIRKLFSGTSLDKLTNERITISSSLGEIDEEIMYLRQQKIKASKRSEQIKAELSDIEKIIQQAGGQIKSDQDYSFQKNEVKNLDDQKSALVEKLNTLSEDLISEAKIIATTLTKSYMHPAIINRSYDCVVLDEASMAPIPAVIAASTLATSKAVIVGDFFQLPPIVKHEVDTEHQTDAEIDLEKRLVSKWLAKDIFNLLGFEDQIRRGSAPDNWFVQLDTQYRMNPEIAEIINELIYAKYNKGFGLKSGDNTLDKGRELLDKEPLAQGHVGIYDTSGLGPIPAKTDGGSWYNLTHALLCVELAKQAKKSGYKNIGIISAYRSQVKLMKNILSDELGDDTKGILVDTVHKFQGGAKQIIIFDVTSPLANSMYDDMHEGGDDEKLMNVAFSRAQEKCILVANIKAVKSNHSAESLVRAFINYCENKNHKVIDATPIVKSYKSTDTEDLWLEKTAGANLSVQYQNGELFDEDGFYKSFISDLLSARQEVIIQSAFLTSNRSEKLMPIFKRLLDKDVRIFVLTRVSDEHDDNMKKQAEKVMKIFSDMGIVVLPFMGKIHQKYAIIDRKILWDGSLNILSQRDSSETMRRCVGQKLTDQYVSFHRLDKNIGPIGSNNLRPCEVCTGPGAYYWLKKAWGRPYLVCLAGNHTPGKPPKTSADRKARLKEKENRLKKSANIRNRITVNNTGKPVCPEHLRELISKTGRFGDYWECPLVKECECRINPKQLEKLL